MDYCCANCEMVIRDEDTEIEEEFIGEAWGRPIYEKHRTCPMCGEDVQEFMGEPFTKIYHNELGSFADLFRPGRRD